MKYMKKQVESEVTQVNVGNKNGFDSNTKDIHFEGANDVLFWRISGNVLNPDCTITVPPTHSAIYIKDGKLQDIFEGGKYRVYEFVKKPGLFNKGKVDAADVDIIFINKTIKVLVKWGTKDPIIYREPITETLVHICGSGVFEVQVSNPKQFYLEIIGEDKLCTVDSLKERIDIRLMSFFSETLQKVVSEKVHSYVDIQKCMKQIGDSVLPIINEYMNKDVGLNVTSFTVARLGVREEEAEKIEKELAKKREELKLKEDAKEIDAKNERLADKDYARKRDESEIEWQRELTLKKMEFDNQEKYYDVLKVFAEHSENNFGNIPFKQKNDFLNRCSKCGKINDSNAKFCMDCGTKLFSEKRYCPECGKEVSDDAKFCMNCGHRM